MGIWDQDDQPLDLWPAPPRRRPWWWLLLLAILATGLFVGGAIAWEWEVQSIATCACAALRQHTP
jgi:hypothetical protein